MLLKTLKTIDMIKRTWEQNLEAVLYQLNSEIKKSERNLEKKHKITERKVPWSLSKLV